MWLNIEEDVVRCLADGTMGLSEQQELRDLARKALEEKTDPVHMRYRQLAEEVHHEDGVLEVDEGAVVSPGDDPGAYVMAWVWVDRPKDLAPAGSEDDEEEEVQP